jgi:excisionase family DNA binding protein
MTESINRATLTIAEVATALGIGRSLAYTLAAEGKFPVLRLGNRLLVPTERFFAWLRDGGV